MAQPNRTMVTTPITGRFAKNGVVVHVTSSVGPNFFRGVSERGDLLCTSNLYRNVGTRSNPIWEVLAVPPA